MNASKVPEWLAEFGPAFAVPDAIAKAPDFTDESWHNDVCPRFVTVKTVNGEKLCVWVEHPEKNEREHGPDCVRYWITKETEEGEMVGETEVFESEDLTAVLAFVKAWGSEVQS